MEFSIDCGVFVRLANIARLTQDGQLRSVYLECHDGKKVAVASDKKIMAVEFLGESVGPDFSMNAAVDDALINQCNIEKSFNGTVTFNYDTSLNYATATTTLGFQHQKNAAVILQEKRNYLKDWGMCFPRKLPTVSNGGMFAKLDRLAALASSAPSGAVVFPEFIDVNEPVVVNDVHDPNWIGVFLSKSEKGDEIDPVSIPSWIRR